MQDQQTCPFWFKITPTQIIPTGKIKTQTLKTVLIKLGNKQGRCKNIGQPIQLTVDVLYSKTLNKYCPIKGIIKIYDIGKDGTQMISCVGAFNTQDLLIEKSKVVDIQRDIGPCRIFLNVEVRNLRAPEAGEKKQVKINEKQAKQNNIIINQTLPINQKSDLRNIQKKFLKSPRLFQNSSQEGPYMMDDSCDFIDDSYKQRYSQASDELKTSQKQALGQQLIEERRKIKALQEKLQKSNIKNQILRKNLSQKNNQIKTYFMNFKNFTAGLQSDPRGQYICQMNEKKRQISLRYKPNIKFKQIFEQFIAFMVKKLTQNNGFISSQKVIDDEIEVNRVLSKIQNFEQEKKKILQQNYKINSQLNKLKTEISQKSIQISTKQTVLRKKMQQNLALQQKIKKQRRQKQELDALNQYLQQRDSELQSILKTKQNTIQSLKKLVTQHNSDLEAIEDKNSKLIRIIQNLENKIQQMKQQNANLAQTIENYRQNYGQLKTAKDRALQRQFKQCLRWIDQQNHDQDLNLQDTTFQSNDQPTTVNSLMRSIGQIENMPLEQISLIRKQVINVLKRLDEFVARNSKSGMSP